MIIYIHGFGGSGEGSKARAFRKYFESIGETFIAPSLSYVPELAIRTLEELINSYKGEVCLIGSSLGGYYATYLAKKIYVKKAVLINPSVYPAKTLQRAIGNAPNFYDGSHYGWSETHIGMLGKYEKNIDDYKYKFMVLLQKGDELLDYREALEKYDGCEMIVEEGGSHGFDGIERYFETIREFFAVGDHFKHTSTVKGIGLDNRELARRVGDLYYDDLAYFLEELSKKLSLDADADSERGRTRLADALEESAKHIDKGAVSMQKAWDICEVHTIRWMMQNGFNRPKYLKNLKNLPDDVKEWYFGKKITMPDMLINELLDHVENEWQKIQDIPGPSLIGTRADLYRFIDAATWEYEEKYPEYADEIGTIVCKKFGV